MIEGRWKEALSEPRFAEYLATQSRGEGFACTEEEYERFEAIQRAEIRAIAEARLASGDVEGYLKCFGSDERFDAFLGLDFEALPDTTY